MKNITRLQLTFDLPLYWSQLPAFRGAISDKAGYDKDLFHNHYPANQADGLHHYYRYPLIQYTLVDGKATLIGYEEGAKALQQFIYDMDWQLSMNGQIHPLRIVDMQRSEHPLVVSDQFRDYRINSWLALNQDNYKAFQEKRFLSTQLMELERLLKAHILAFAKGVDWYIDETIQLGILSVHKRKWLNFKDVRFMAYDLAFSTNVSLPPNVGLGKAISHGFGGVKPIEIRDKKASPNAVHQMVMV